MVGSSSAFALMQSGLFSEMVLVDVAKDRAEGEAMGYALAKAARNAGAQVTLVAGPNDLPAVAGVETVPVVSAGDMAQAVLERSAGMDAIIMEDPVPDYSTWSQNYIRRYGNSEVFDQIFQRILKEAMKSLILASQSPRRRELLEKCGLPFTVDAADIDETIDPAKDLVQEIERLAVRKAQAVLERHPQDVVIGSDTIVTIDGKVLGKPHTPENAKAMRCVKLRIQAIRLIPTAEY